jgi:hypothetical protein
MFNKKEVLLGVKTRFVLPAGRSKREKQFKDKHKEHFYKRNF